MNAERCVREPAGRIPPLDEEAARQASARLDSLTKPPGSLGVLEDLVVRMAAVGATARPRVRRPVVAVMAADHGVVARGVSPYPQEVTAQMVTNIESGGAAVDALARWARAEVVVTDVGVAGPKGGGTADMTLGPAMSEAEAAVAVEVGRSVARSLHAGGSTIVACGEMGIGNTTAAAALTSALAAADVSRCVGPGTGLDAAGVSHKERVVRTALERNRVDGGDPWQALVRVGGLEIASLAGLILEASVLRLAVVIDGFVSGAAALVACAFAPGLQHRLFFGHRSSEPGVEVQTAAMGAEPILDLGMRLGEGSGAVLALGLIDAACRTYGEMATFEGAGVSERG